MFGYIKTDRNELLVKHDNVYRALYCGLCRTAEKEVTRLLLPFHSYDFVFLAAFRLSLSDEKPRVGKTRCFLHPLKKRPAISSSPELLFCARAELYMVQMKMADDISDPDTPLFVKMLLKPYRRILQKKLVKEKAADEKFSALCTDLDGIFAGFYEYEKNKASLDTMCIAFGKAMSRVFSFGFEGEFAEKVSRTGDMLGRFLYTADALDDIDRDSKKHSFNPLISSYGTPEKVRDSIGDIDMVTSFYISESASEYALLPHDDTFGAIVRNVFDCGLKKVMREAASKKNGGKNTAERKKHDKESL